MKSTASPYLCEIVIDIERAFESQDLMSFQRKVERGVAVYGYTPNVLLRVTEEYGFWESLTKLVNELDAGKVAICGPNLVDKSFGLLQCVNKNIQLRLFAGMQVSEAREWLSV